MISVGFFLSVPPRSRAACFGRASVFLIQCGTGLGISKIIGKYVDQFLDHVEGRSETYIRHGMIMNPSVVGDSHMPRYRLTIHFYPIGCPDYNMVTLVVCLSGAFRRSNAGAPDSVLPEKHAFLRTNRWNLPSAALKDSCLA